MRIAISYMCLVSLTLVSAALAQEWPQFRGPDGQGHAAVSAPPTTWSETENIAWKTPIPGTGWSSPVVNGEQIWLTSAIEEDNTLRAICVDRTSGQIVHDVEVFRKTDLGRVNAKNTNASPTPILDGQRVFVHFGSHGTACLSSEGKLLWKTELKYDHRHGPGGSPVLVGDVLIVACDGADVQYVVGLDANTGRLRWKTPRHDKAEMAYSTPLVIEVDGAEQVVSSGGGGVSGYDPATGKEIWRCRYEGHSVIPRPVFADGLTYVCSGYWTPTLYAIQAGGASDITSTHISRTVRRGVPLTTSPLVNGDELYLMGDMGVLTAIDLGTGKELWRERLPGSYSASPTLAAGHVYAVNEEGTTTVLKPGPKPTRVATNQIEGRTLASPAFVGGAIFLRSDTHLYCIGKPGRPPLRTAARVRSAKRDPNDGSKVRRASATAPR